MLTEQQGTPDWFLMRKFRVTGLVAISILDAIAKLPLESEAVLACTENWQRELQSVLLFVC